MRWADEALDQAIQDRRACWLSAFAIQAQPLRQEILLAIDECDPAAWKQKRILRLSWAEGKTRIMKVTQEAQVTPDQIEARCGFCEALRQGGVRTIRYLKTKSGYCLKDEGYCITLEEDARPGFEKNQSCSRCENWCTDSADAQNSAGDGAASALFDNL